MTEKPWYKNFWVIVIVIIAFTVILNMLPTKPQQEIKSENTAVEKDTRTGPPNTLKKHSTVCLTKELLGEISQNRNDKAHMMKMLSDGKCVMLLSDSVVPVEHLEGILPLIKIKMQWGDRTFIGWTDTTNVN
jgi:hypothetical protein